MVEKAEIPGDLRRWLAVCVLDTLVTIFRARSRARLRNSQLRGDTKQP
jgi:hypothetical protein